MKRTFKIYYRSYWWEGMGWLFMYGTHNKKLAWVSILFITIKLLK